MSPPRRVPPSYSCCCCCPRKMVDATFNVDCSDCFAPMRNTNIENKQCRQTKTPPAIFLPSFFQIDFSTSQTCSKQQHIQNKHQRILTHAHTHSLSPTHTRPLLRIQLNWICVVVGRFGWFLGFTQIGRLASLLGRIKCPYQRGQVHSSYPSGKSL